MGVFHSNCTGFIPAPDKPSFHEQWVSGTYIVAGVFPLFETELMPDKIAGLIPELLSQTKKRKRAAWPRGICAYYLIPIYCSTGFPEETIEWIKTRPKYRWAIWHEPVLFNTHENAACSFTKRGLYCLAFLEFLSTIVVGGICSISREHGFTTQPRLNGNEIQKKDDPTISCTRFQ